MKSLATIIDRALLCYMARTGLLYTAVILQYSAAVRDAKNDQVETTIGTAPILELWSGTIPANCAAGDAGDGAKLANGTLPSDWMSNSSGGVKAKTGTWTITGLAAAGTGVAVTHYRIYDSGRATCHEQGNVGVTGASTAMTMDNTSIANAQVATVTTYSKTSGNA